MGLFIFDIEKELSKYNLTKDTYRKLLQDCSDKVAKITDTDWSEIALKYGLDFNPDTCRKAQQPPLLGGAFVRQFYEEEFSHSSTALDEDEYFNKLRLEKQEIKKEKQKLFDERLDINRRLREASRLETTIEKLESMLFEIGDKRYLHYEPISNISGNDLVVCLSDLHIGATYYGFDGIYDSEIAKKRLNQYLSEIIGIQKSHNAENCHVLLLGDLLSGNIHKTISITNKENVIEQVKLACEYISDFVYTLGLYFSKVEVHAVSGNHSRIDKKEDALLSERLDTLIPWFIKSMLKNCKNIHVDDDCLDDTLSTFFIRDKLYFAVHGDFDSVTDSSIAKLALWAKMTPYCVFCGHKHHPAMTDISGIKVIQSGTLGGSGDEYTRQKRLTGKPSQTVAVVSDKGVRAVYPIEFE